MRRGRLIFWSVSGVVIAAGVGALLWLQYSQSRPPRMAADPSVARLMQEATARADQPPEPWAPATAWWKRTTIDAFDRAAQGRTWPSARRAVVAFGRDLSNDPPRTGDEVADARDAAATAVDYGCDDPLVLFVRGRYLFRSTDPNVRRDGSGHLARAADGFRADVRYPAYVRCLAGYEAAEALATAPPFRVPQSKAAEHAAAAAGLLPEVAVDREMPRAAVLWLAEAIGDAARRLKRDRAEMVNPLLDAMDKGGQPKMAVLTVKGDFLTSYAWDARGSGWGDTVSGEGWKGFRDRLAGARTALEQAWEADKTNGNAAARMISVCMGDGSERPEMEKWFRRAMEADPGNYNACSRKMLYLEPKWGGSAAAMILFGRELTRTATDPRAVRIPLTLVDAHWTLAESLGGPDGPRPAYFADNPDLWDDVGRVYETYLKHVPASRYHRTRYAVIAGWAGRWDVAAAQFEQLGDRFSREVVPEGVVKALRERAKQETAKAKTAGAV